MTIMRQTLSSRKEPSVGIAGTAHGSGSGSRSPSIPSHELRGAAPGWGALGDKTLGIPSLQGKCNRDRPGEGAAGQRRGPRGAQRPTVPGALPARGTAPRCPSRPGTRSRRPPPGPRLSQPRAGAAPPPCPPGAERRPSAEPPRERCRRLSAPHPRGRAGTAAGPAPRWLRLAGRGQRGAAGPPAPPRSARPGECGECGAVPGPRRSAAGISLSGKRRASPEERAEKGWGAGGPSGATHGHTAGTGDHGCTQHQEPRVDLCEGN